jgi:hypothetical protein
MFTNKKKREERKMLNREDRIKYNEIVCALIVSNMKAGLSYERAKVVTFNRLHKESPEVLKAWLNRNKK